jgi:hypothetical protein
MKVLVILIPLTFVAFEQSGMRRHIADDSTRVTGGCGQT